MKHFLQKYFWLIALNVITISTAIINFPVGKYFMGWDALNPEFNIPLNITRALFPFWQENYGLGALTGHGFASTLPHTLLIGLMSLVLPQWSVRSVFTFICFYLGGVGMYFLVHYILTKLSTLRFASIKFAIPIISFVGALYYLYNLGSVQVFYIQLEAFIVQYASLPWLFLTVFLVLDQNKKRNYLFLFLTSIAASIQGFIPSLFASYIVSLLILLAVFLLTYRSKDSLKKVGFVLGITLLANIYWILPVVYFQVTRGSFFLSSYNNLSSTPHFIELSTRYGSLANVALLKSYLFGSYELGGYILQPWITHLQFFAIPFIGYAFFAVILAGAITSLIKLRSYYTYVFSLAFLYFFTSLAIDTFPFNLLTKILQTISPTYEQAFRTTFTKFGIGMSFLYSVELCFALFLVAYLLISLKKKLLFYLTCALIVIALFLYALPVFNGNLLYKKLQLNVPPAYFDFMNYINSKPDGRIADFPQYCSSGWYAYNWGYFGSGFLWYGTNQPFLSRSFDVWNNNNENYYWELSQALNQKDYEKVNIILNKYHVSWVLFDPNVISCASQKSITDNNGLLTYLENKKGYSIEKAFTKGVSHPITLLKNTNLADNSFVSAQNNTVNIGPATQWMDSDIASSTYYTSPGGGYNYYYPFRSLLTKRGQNNGSEPAISIKNGVISFTTALPPLKDYSFNTPPYNSLEKTVPVRFAIESNQTDTYSLSLQLLFPEVKLNNALLTLPSPKIQLGNLSKAQLVNPNIFLNGQKVNRNNSSYTSLFSTDLNNTIEIVENGQIVFSWNSESDPIFHQELSKQTEQKINNTQKGIFTITIPAVADNTYFGVNKIDLSTITPEPCNEVKPTNRNVFEVNTQENNQYVRLISNDSTQCIKLHFPNLFGNQSYLMAITTKNISGNLPKTSLYNNGSLIYTDLSTGKENELKTSYYVIPSSSSSEVGYDLEFENSSHSKVTSTNDFYGVSLYPIAYNFIKNAALTNNLQINKPVENVTGLTVKHPNPTTYIASLSNNIQQLTLSQSYDPGWKAYALKTENSKLKTILGNTLPFIFGKELKNHVKVNNWANGWKIDNSQFSILNPDIIGVNSQIIIVYLPQYLGYIGIFALFIAMSIVIIYPLKHHLSGNKLNDYFEAKTEEIKKKIRKTLSSR